MGACSLRACRITKRLRTCEWWRSSLERATKEWADSSFKPIKRSCRTFRDGGIHLLNRYRLPALTSEHPVQFPHRERAGKDFELRSFFFRGFSSLPWALLQCSVLGLDYQRRPLPKHKLS